MNHYLFRCSKGKIKRIRPKKKGIIKNPNLFDLPEVNLDKKEKQKTEECVNGFTK